jgi:hypothetical protein
LCSLFTRFQKAGWRGILAYSTEEFSNKLTEVLKLDLMKKLFGLRCFLNSEVGDVDYRPFLAGCFLKRRFEWNSNIDEGEGF